jgi:hypothetical protein
MGDGLSALVANYSSDESAADDQILSDTNQKMSSSDDCVIRSTDAAETEKPKLFSRQMHLHNYFKSPTRQPTVEEKVNQAIESNASKIMPPKGHMKVWRDHLSDKDKLRRRVSDKRRRDAAHANLDARIEITVRKYVDKHSKASTDSVDVEAAVDESVDELTKLKKSKKAVSRKDSESQGRTTKITGIRPLTYSSAAVSGKTKWTADQRFYVWNAFKDFHFLSPSDNGDKAAVDLISKGGSACRYAELVKVISRQRPAEFGGGILNRQNLNKMLGLMAKNPTTAFVGRKCTLPTAVIALVISTLLSIISTRSTLWSASMLQPIAIAVIVAAGSGALISNTKGKGNFSCSKNWIWSLCSEQGWRFKQPQGDTRKLPTNWKELIYLMLLRAMYFISMHGIQPALFVNADHTGIMHLQQKGGGWFKTDEGEGATVAGHGNKSQFTLVHATSASGVSLPAQVIMQGKASLSLPRINGILYTPSTISPAAGGKKKERQAAAQTGKTDKLTSLWVVDRKKSTKEANKKTEQIASLALTHDHWADANTSKGFIQDVIKPYYEQTCAANGFGTGQKMLLLVDCWWGWLDPDFRDWLHLHHPYVLLLICPAKCTPVGQPEDNGIIACLKGIHKHYHDYIPLISIALYKQLFLFVLRLIEVFLWTLGGIHHSACS